MKKLFKTLRRFKTSFNNLTVCKESTKLSRWICKNHLVCNKSTCNDQSRIFFFISWLIIVMCLYFGVGKSLRQRHKSKYNRRGSEAYGEVRITWPILTSLFLRPGPCLWTETFWFYNFNFIANHKRNFNQSVWLGSSKEVIITWPVWPLSDLCLVLGQGLLIMEHGSRGSSGSAPFRSTATCIQVSGGRIKLVKVVAAAVLWVEVRENIMNWREMNSVMALVYRY